MAIVQPLSHTACVVAARTLLQQTEDTSSILYSSLVNRLTNDEYATVSGAVLYYIVENFPHKLTSDLLTALAPPDLKQLNLIECQSITPRGVQGVINKCSGLQHVDVSGCDQLSHPVFYQLCGLGAPHLSTLTVNKCASLSDLSVKEIFRHLPSLRQLSVSQCGDLTDDAFMVNKKWQVSCENATQMGHKASDYPCRLASVDVSGCSGLTSVAVRHLTSLCGPTLRRVNLANTYIDSTALWYLSGYCLASAVQLAIEVERLQLESIQETTTDIQFESVHNDSPRDTHSGTHMTPKSSASCEIPDGQETSSTPVLPNNSKDASECSHYNVTDNPDVFVHSPGFVSSDNSSEYFFDDNNGAKKDVHSIISHTVELLPIFTVLFEVGTLSISGSSSIQSDGSTSTSKNLDLDNDNESDSEFAAETDVATGLTNSGLNNDQQFFSHVKISDELLGIILSGGTRNVAKELVTTLMQQQKLQDDDEISSSHARNYVDDVDAALCGSMATYLMSPEQMPRSTDLLKDMGFKECSSSSSSSLFNATPRLPQLYKPQLQNVDINNIEFPSQALGEACFKALLLTNTSLQRLSMSWKELKDEMLDFVGQNGRSLQSLTLSGCDGLTSYGVARLCNQCDQLKNLNLQGVCFISDAAVVPLVTKGYVQQLGLSETNVTDMTLSQLAKHTGSELRQLDLSWCEEVTSVGVCAVAARCSSLQSLQLRQVAVSEQCLHLLAAHCTNLTHLDLSGLTAHSLTDHSLSALALGLSQLCSIDLSWNLAVGDIGLGTLLRCCGHLRKLVASGLKQITSSPFLPIIADLPRWRQCQALLRLKLQEQQILREDEHFSSSDEEFESLCVPHRSTIYAPQLRLLMLEYCDLVSDRHLAELVAVCRGSLRVKDYYDQWVEPAFVVAQKGRIVFAPQQN